MVKRVLELIQEVLGGERFRDIGRVLENGGGDCFPIDTRVVRYVPRGLAEIVSIANVQRGDMIRGRARWSEVRANVAKGVLAVDRVVLADGKSFTLTRDHKVFIVRHDNVQRVPVGQLERGMVMIRHTQTLPLLPRPKLLFYNESAWAAVDATTEEHVSVAEVQRDACSVPCVDVETDDHYVYLLDADILVSQCDNLNTWRCAELRQAGIPARPMMTSRSRMGGTTYHAIVRWPPFGDAISGNPFMDSDEDPSLLLGMSQPQRKVERDIEIAKNIERCDYIRRYKARGGAMPGVDLDAALQDVLGLRRFANPTFEAAIEHLLNGARA